MQKLFFFIISFCFPLLLSAFQANLLSNLKVREKLSIVAYSGHMINIHEKTNLGFAYTFLRRENDFILYKLNPYSENIYSSIKDSAIVDLSTISKIDSIVSYYRNSKKDSHIEDWCTNIIFKWEIINESNEEKYFDCSGKYNIYFPNDPMMSIITNAGFK